MAAVRPGGGQPTRGLGRWSHWWVLAERREPRATFHPNLTAQFLVPVIVWRVVRLRERGRWLRDGLVLAALVVWQVFINEETLLITALACGLFLLLYKPRQGWRPLLAGLGVTAAAALVVLAYPLWWQFAGTGSYHGGEQQMTQFHTDLLGLTSFSLTSLATRLSEHQPASVFSAERHAQWGLPLVIAVTAVAIWLWREPLVRAIAVTGLVFVVLSFGTELTVGGQATGVPGPYALLHRLPLFNTVLPTRLSEAGTWAIAPLAAIGLARLRGPRVLLIGLTAALLVPAAPAPIRVTGRPPVPKFVSSGEWRSFVGPHQSVLIVPFASFDNYQPMQWAAATGLDMPLSHGYFLGPADGIDGHRAIVGPPPRPTDEVIMRGGPVSDADRSQARADLAYWHTAIILAPDGASAAPARATLDSLVGMGRHIDGVWLWDLRNR